MCLICERIQLIEEGKNPYFVKEFETGYVVIGDHQHFRGYTLFLSKKHVRELHDVPKEWRDKQLSEMADISEAVSKAFLADKMNIESLGNGESHLHWHLFPRKSGDLLDHGHNGKGPVWWLPFQEMYAVANQINGQELLDLKQQLLSRLEKN